MPSAQVEFEVGGHAYRVHTDTDPDKLRHLASLIDDQIRQCDPRGKLTATQALLYAALALAERLEEERADTLRFEGQTRHNLQDILRRIDSAIDATEPLVPRHADKPRDNTASTQ